MRTSWPHRHTCTAWFSVVALLTPVTLSPKPAGQPQCDASVKVQLTTDKLIYAPGTIMHVKLLIANAGEVPLYLFHAISQCSSPYGSLSIRLYDDGDRPVDIGGCSSDDFEMNKHNLVDLLTKSESGILLRPGDMYGQEQEYRLPKEKGIYRVRGVLAPVGFVTDSQKQALAQHRMNIVKGACTSLMAKITIK